MITSTPPVIITGMHRSGTTLITRILQQLGLFTGAYRTMDLEASFFVVRNEFLLQRAGGSWDYPLPCKEMIAKPEFAEGTIRLMKRGISSFEFLEYTGVSKALQQVFFPKKTIWGWKDPRNVFTLPIWREIFPEAKLIVIYRNGVDVANSLTRRTQVRETNSILRGLLAPPSARRRLINLIRPIPVYGEGYTVRCTELSASFDLWDEYTSEAINQFSQWPYSKLSLKFEDLLDEPKYYTDRLAQFCDLSSAPDVLDKIASNIQQTKAFAFKDNEKLRVFYEKIAFSPSMQTLGYDKLI